MTFFTTAEPAGAGESELLMSRLGRPLVTDDFERKELGGSVKTESVNMGSIADGQFYQWR